MQTLRRWLRGWLGIDALSGDIGQTSAYAKHLSGWAVKNAADQQVVIVRIDGSVTHLLQRIQAVESENVDFTRELDELKKDFIAQAVKPKPKERSEPEKRGREPWPVRRARIEAEESKQAERSVVS